MKPLLKTIALLLATATAPAAMALTGDVNGDNIVNGSDVTSLYGYLLDNTPVNGNADVNNDGSVSGADVTALYNILLNPQEEKPAVLVGGDISMFPRYEENNARYFDLSGARVTDVLGYLKQLGWNAFRLRLFVNPENASATDRNDGVIQNLDYVKTLGKRIKDNGFQFMLDIHYSDSWADPAHQTLPAAWKSLSTEQLIAKVGEYTTQVLTELKAAGAEPDLIQTGNEITYGMLWPSGHVWPAGGGQDGGSWDNFVAYLRAASSACRQVCPDAKIIIHAAMTKNSNNPINFYKTLKPYNLDYDVIGLSYYPAYSGSVAVLETVLRNIESTEPDKEIMIVETGYSYAWAMNDTSFDLSSTYPYSEEGQRKITADIVAKLKTHEAVTGLFWWWPEQNDYYTYPQVTPSWWNASLVDSRNGRFQAAAAELPKLLEE